MNNHNSRTVRVEQVLFARLDGLPDTQVVYRSSRLSANLITTLNERVRSFLPHGDPLRLQFFPLDQHYFALTHTVATAPATTPAGPPFLAHAVVIERQQLALVDNNPFRLLAGIQFVEDPQAVPEFVRAAIDNGDAVLLDVPLDVWHGSDWTLREARRLVSLAIHAEALLRRGRSLKLVGADSAALDALYVAFALMPPARRLACSFDSCVDRAGLRTGAVWAAGYTQPHSLPSFIEVDVNERRVREAPEAGYDSQDLYLHWLWSLEDYFLVDEVLLRMAATVQELARCFANKSEPQLADLDPRAAERFAALHRTKVGAGLVTALRRHADLRYESNLVEFIYRITSTDEWPSVLAVAASQQIEVADVVHIILGWLLERRPELRESDWRTTLALFEKAKACELLEQLVHQIDDWDADDLIVFERATRHHAHLLPKLTAVLQQRRSKV